MKLKPCPFCGSISIEQLLNEYGADTVECEDCNASGPTCETAEEAIEKWNDRKDEK